MMKNNFTIILAIFFGFSIMLTPKLSLAQDETGFLWCKENTSADIVIGKGTAFTHSSQVQFFNVTNVQIIGNFIIDNNFIFENKNVSINNDVSIIVQNEGNLTLRNSNLFACDLLWNGIFLRGQTSIQSFDSKIEDAKTAIFSKSSTTLNLNNTTFNKNVIGIQLEKDFLGSPQINTFIKNSFTCTSPINGTSDQFTEAGILLRKVNINLNLNTISPINNSIFQGIQNGIVVEGINSKLVANGLEFLDIEVNGIDMSGKELKIENSKFENCGSNGLLMENVYKLDVQQSEFVINEAVKGMRPRSGIRTNGFLDNAILIIKDNTQNYNLIETSSSSKIYGMRLIGNSNTSNANILFEGNTSNLYDKNSSACIFLDGVFPATSSVDIRVNNFYCSSSSFFSPSENYAMGIYSSGDRENMNLQANFFDNYNGIDDKLLGIYLENSGGTNNLISENDAFGFNGVFMKLQGFRNSIICSNTPLSSIFGAVYPSTGFEFSGDNSGTQFTRNIMYGMGFAVKLNSDAIIGPQIHQGNLWTSFGLFDASPRGILCDNCDVEENRFEVHTDQSTAGVYEYTYYSPYFPLRTFPDDIMIKTDGAPPTSGCIQLFANQEPPVEELIGSSNDENHKAINPINTLIPSDQVFKVYPNPTDHQFTIDVLGEGVSQIFITDISGKELISQKVINVNSFNFELEPGLYYVRVRMKSGEMVTKKLQVF